MKKASEKRQSAAKSKSAPRRRDPERTRQKLMEAATFLFSKKGYDGTTLEEIAGRARTSKQLVVHYFRSKDRLYQEVLESAYAMHRAGDRTLNLADYEPVEAVERLVRYMFENSVRNPGFSLLVADENRHNARHIAKSQRIKGDHVFLTSEIDAVLKRGAKGGLFRRNVDPVAFYIFVMGAISFFFTNSRTLSAVFQRDFRSAAELKLWQEQIARGALAFLARGAA